MKVTVHAPATIANLVCGFDVLGLAVQEPFDIITVTKLNQKRVVMEPDPLFDLPTDPEKNVSGAPLLAMLEAIDDEIGFSVKLEKRIKPGSGIGSSASSAAGVVVAANALLGNRFDQNELIQYAMLGEKVASGVKHADNIAPCIFGGITLIRSIFPLDIIALAAPDLYVAIVHPQIEVKTADARAVLKTRIELKDAIRQWGNIAGLVAGILQNNYELIGRSLQDHIIEPVRSILIPGYDELKRSCLDAGAIGGGISGSGPSVFMLCANKETAEKVGDVMRTVFNKLTIDHHIYLTRIANEGVRIVSTEA